MAKYQAIEQTYLTNSKASVIFQKMYYEPKNKAEEELLDEAVKTGKVKKLGVDKVVKQVEEVNSDLDIIKGEYKSAHPDNKEVPVNKKNDIEWIKEKTIEFNSVTKD